MSDGEERPTRSRKNTSGAGSQRSGASGPASLHRLPSASAYLDDQNHYHGHGYQDDSKEEEALGDDGTTDDSDLTELETKDGQVAEIVPEVRDGIEDQRDLEAEPKLEKSKTTRSERSTRDPNLVTWDGPDDQGNPKNWSMRRKWAATLIGQ